MPVYEGSTHILLSLLDARCSLDLRQTSQHDFGSSPCTFLFGSSDLFRLVQTVGAQDMPDGEDEQIKEGRDTPRCDHCDGCYQTP